MTTTDALQQLREYCKSEKSKILRSRNFCKNRDYHDGRVSEIEYFKVRLDAILEDAAKGNWL